MNTLLVATRNFGKVREIGEILKDSNFEIRTPDDVGIKGEIEETGSSYEENAIIKAKNMGELSQRLTLAEDSGLEIDALGGKPGIFSARHVIGTDEDRIDSILLQLKGLPIELRKARYKAVVAIYDPKKKSTYTFSGVSDGHITEERIGHRGFGYDPIFYSDDLKMTFGEASDEEKNRVSHRARALMKCKSYLKNYNDS